MRRAGLLLVLIFSTAIMAAFAVDPEMWADHVVDYQQGLRKDGTPVLPERSNASKVLGPPDSGSEVNFFSLGFGGWIIVGFPYPLANGPGSDALVVETTWGTYPLETANVYVSQNGTDWFLAGSVDNNGNSVVPIPETLPWVNYVKVVDTCDPALFEATADGYDVDAIGAYYMLSEVYLDITTTGGGTTTPSPGLYNYSTGTNVSVTALADPNYCFDHWELDSVDVGAVNPYVVHMNENHTLHAVFVSRPSVTISPLSSTIFLGESVTFTSSVSGGTPPYSYQWYLDDAPVAGATASSWTFNPPAVSTYTVYLEVADSRACTGESPRATIVVVPQPVVGGHTTSINIPNVEKPSIYYIMFLATLFGAVAAVKRKFATSK
jgi:hypothetical protein